MQEAFKVSAGPADESCDPRVLLNQIAPGCEDKLHNKIKEILWRGANYAIYCSGKGIYVHFSDCKEEEEDQRKRFTKICPELCELRYLIAQMRGWIWWPWSHKRRHTLYEHNMAQALMLIMENRDDEPKSSEQATKLAQQTLAMAVRRVTNDNTIRYGVASLSSGVFFVLIGTLALLWLNGSPDMVKWKPYVVAAMSGAAGAVFSIVMRLENFQFMPCDQSNMNYFMSMIRVLMGVMSGTALLLFADTMLSDMAKKLSNSPAFNTQNGVLWEVVVIFGFIGGFAERLIPNILRQTIDRIESGAGTPVQAVRNQESQAKAAKVDSANAHATA
jgi:hypothetical protein